MDSAKATLRSAVIGLTPKTPSELAQNTKARRVPIYGAKLELAFPICFSVNL